MSDISSFRFLGEFLLALWLVMRTDRMAVSTSRHDNEKVAVAH